MLKRMQMVLVVGLLWAGLDAAAALQGSDIERFIQTYQQLEQVVDFDEDDDDLDDDENLDLFDLEAVQSRLAKLLAQYPESTAIIRANGYRSTAQFTEQWAVILRAYISHGLSQALGEIDQSLARLSDEDRATAMHMGAIQQAQRLRKQLASVPAAELEAVKPHLPMLDQLFQDDDDWDDDWDDEWDD